MVAGDERVSLKDAVNREKQRDRESDNFRDVFIRQKKRCQQEGLSGFLVEY